MSVQMMTDPLFADNETVQYQLYGDSNSFTTSSLERGSKLDFKSLFQKVGSAITRDSSIFRFRTIFIFDYCFKNSY